MGFIDLDTLHRPAQGVLPPTTWHKQINDNFNDQQVQIADAVTASEHPLRGGQAFVSSNVFSVGSGGANTTMGFPNGSLFKFSRASSDTHIGPINPTPGTPPANPGGIYRVTAYALWGNDTGGTRQCIILENGAEAKHNYQQPSNGGQATNELTASVPMSAPSGTGSGQADYISIEVWQNSGNLVSVQVFLDIVHEGPYLGE